MSCLSKSVSELPQICTACHKLKAANLGRFYRGQRYSQWRWICLACDDKRPERCARHNYPETPPEREVREALSECGLKFKAEFPVGPYIYDFAVPAIRLLIEVDSKTWHSTPRQLKRDARKDAYAKAEQWELKRFKTGSGLGSAVLAEVLRRKAGLEL